MRALQRFFGSWRFPAFALPLLLLVQAAMLGLLLVPAGEGPLGRFAEELKVWCFGYDPATGSVQRAYVAMFLLDPLVLGALVTLVWWRPLSRVARRLPWAFAPYAGAALLAAFAGAFGLVAAQGLDAPQDPTVFPADRLRVALPAPDVTGLVDQEGRPVLAGELRGRVVVVTAVYATCGYTCPMILEQARGALADLLPDEQARVTVLGVTLDPARDTPEAMARMAEGQGVSAPLFRLLSGPPARVEATLDAMGVTRRRDEATGVIDHANVFLLVDAGGRVAFRFGLGDLQERWLAEALRLLVAEVEDGPPPPREGT
jgi:protein SCO1/2